MTAKLQIQPLNLLDEDFTPEDLHPADIEQIVIAAIEHYQDGDISSHLRKKYRDKVNSLIDLLHEKRERKIFNYLK